MYCYIVDSYERTLTRPLVNEFPHLIPRKQSLISAMLTYMCVQEDTRASDLVVLRPAAHSPHWLCRPRSSSRLLKPLGLQPVAAKASRQNHDHS